MRLLLITLFVSSAFASITPYSSLAECISCHATIAALRDYSKNPDHYTKIVNLVKEMCPGISKMTPEVCDGIVNEFTPVVLDVLANKFLDPDYMCVQLEYCTTPKYVEENFTDFTNTVMKGKPPGPGPQPSGGESFTFIHISDIHLDIYYEVGTNDECDEPQCCRNGTGNAGQWGGWKCDLPVRTLDAALEQVKALNPDFIAITGDFPPHDVWNQSKSYNIGYQKIVSDAFKRHFTNTPIYVMFGNHACYPINQCPFGLEQWIPQPFCEDWGCSELTKLSIETNAGYSMRHGLTNLRIIMLDTNTGNSGNFYLAPNSTDPQGQINWLYKELLAAEANKEQVYLFGHIPPGDVDCLSMWSRHMNVLMDRFEYTIAGQFYGHTHTDELHINRGVSSNQPTKVQWVVPSFTTYSSHNPSFRLYKADKLSKVLLDYTQFRMDLINANANPTVSPLWDAAYSFKEYYGVSDMSAQTVYELALQIGNNQQTTLMYLNNFYSGHNPPTSCDHRCMHELMCKITYGVLDDVLACQGIDPDWTYKLAEIVIGTAWYYKIK